MSRASATSPWQALRAPVDEAPFVAKITGFASRITYAGAQAAPTPPRSPFRGQAGARLHSCAWEGPRPLGCRGSVVGGCLQARGAFAAPCIGDLGPTPVVSPSMRRFFGRISAATSHSTVWRTPPQTSPWKPHVTGCRSALASALALCTRRSTRTTRRAGTAWSANLGAREGHGRGPLVTVRALLCEGCPPQVLRRRLRRPFRPLSIPFSSRLAPEHLRPA